MMVGRSQVMDELRVRVARVAETSFTVLVEGESGAGKELVARDLHLRSRRQRGPFVAVNCGALVETLVEAELFGIEERTATGVKGRRGKFEQADRGTLFLDEVADLSPAAQAKLLRVLQDMSVERVGGQTSCIVDTRVVAATNRSLKAMVKAGRFREDLYYRLAGVEIFVPPLRARRADIPLLVDHFLQLHRRATSLAMSAAALEALVAYDWPGNVRQLARVVERAVALSPGPRIGVGDLPGEITQEYGDLLQEVPDRDDSLRAWCSRYVRLVLDRCEGNKRRACEILDITYHTLNSHLSYSSGARALRVCETDEATDIASLVASDGSPAMRE
jgi:DNA-binding NtrC family response regulator